MCACTCTQMSNVQIHATLLQFIIIKMVKKKGFDFIGLSHQTWTFVDKMRKV